MPGTLYLVATPIGNLNDITYRAVEVLKQVDLIACEDTRHSRKLLQHYGIDTKTISYHEHNELERSRQLLKLLAEGTDLAVISDAGTPLINDPGYRLLRLAVEKNITAVPIPGPSAVVTALVASGLPTDQFLFAGFLPPRSGARRARLNELRAIPATLVFYEAPHRLAASLKDGFEILGEREAVVARELTKLHEQIKRGRLSSLAEYFSESQNARGEIVLLINHSVIEPPAGASVQKTIAQLVRQFEGEGFDHRTALKKAARELKIPRAEAYRLMVAQRAD
ncbi:MAG: 16S rRNA (cytidine(1402)-2'-O)-methyltransferase [Pyrinomonadaceae bacterium]